MEDGEVNETKDSSSSLSSSDVSTTSDSDSDSDSDADSGSDMDPVLDAVSSKLPPSTHPPLSLAKPTAPYPDGSNEADTVPAFVPDLPLLPRPASSPTQIQPQIQIHTQNTKAPRRRKPAHGPSKPRANPFSQSARSRPTLLRNLLQREVEVTLSNLSQAIRFIVANDCLKNVEMKPGDAEEERLRKERVVVLKEGGDRNVEAEEGEEVSAASGEMVVDALDEELHGGKSLIAEVK